jgi:signal transduction histidine kinase
MSDQHPVTAPPSGEAAATGRFTRIAREVAILAGVSVVQLGMTTGAAAAQRDNRGWGPPHDADAVPLWPWGYLVLALAVAALPFRHRWPTATLGVVFAFTLGYWVADFPPGPVFAALVVAFARVVSEGRRRTAIGVAVLGYLLFPWLGWLIRGQDPPTVTALALLGAWLVTLVAVTEAIRFRRDRARERKLSQAEAQRRQVGEERLRIAREVHDAVAHAMSLITIQAGVALHRGGDLPPETREALGVIRSTSREALVELRGILGVLRDVDGQAPRAPTPGLSRLDDLRRWADGVGLDLRLTAGDLPAGGVPGTVDVAAYRILQEALTNAVRHAGPCRVTADVRVAGGVLLLEVLDDGRGPVAPRAGDLGGNGIVGMRERASAVGGTLTAGARPGGGFAVRARLPLPEPADEPEREPAAEPEAPTASGGAAVGHEREPAS